MTPSEKITPENKEVAPTCSPLATCRVDQYVIRGSTIRKYEIMPPIIDQTPNSSGESFRVTISVKTIPVNTLIIATDNAINPEYVTRMLLNYLS